MPPLDPETPGKASKRQRRDFTLQPELPERAACPRNEDCEHVNPVPKTKGSWRYAELVGHPAGSPQQVPVALCKDCKPNTG